MQGLRRGAHLGCAAVALLARLHHTVAADGPALPGQAGAAEQTRAPALLQEALKVPDAAVAKGFCPAEMSKNKAIVSLCVPHSSPHPVSPKLCARQGLAQTLARG